MIAQLSHSIRFLALLAVVAAAVAVAADEPVVLFEGKSMDQWDVIGCEAVVEQGAILLKSGNGLVQTKKQYADYTFECEWKTLESDGWDSGIYFRYTEVPQGQPWPKQYQVNLRKGMEGDLVGFEKAVNSVPLKPQEWTRFELTVRGSTATLKVNGKTAWKAEGIEAPRGYVALQAEVPGGGKFLFRKIRITELQP